MHRITRVRDSPRGPHFRHIVFLTKTGLRPRCRQRRLLSQHPSVLFDHRSPSSVTALTRVAIDCGGSDSSAVQRTLTAAQRVLRKRPHQSILYQHQDLILLDGITGEEKFSEVQLYQAAGWVTTMDLLAEHHLHHLLYQDGSRREISMQPT